METCQQCLSPLVPIPGLQPDDTFLAFEANLDPHRAPENERSGSLSSPISTQSQAASSVTVSSSLFQAWSIAAIEAKSNSRIIYE